MVRCTAQGHAEKPGLPLTELHVIQLKEEIRNTLPQYWNAPHEMELIWSKCTEAISQGCKQLRSKKRPHKPISTPFPQQLTVFMKV